MIFISYLTEILIVANFFHYPVPTFKSANFLTLFSEAPHSQIKKNIKWDEINS